MKFGLIGIGKFGKHYIKNINEIKGAELVGCSSRTKESFFALPKEITDKRIVWMPPEDFLSSIGLVDTVVIATHPDSHFKYAKAALESGKHVICEKPCMFSEKEYYEIKSLCLSSRKHFFTNYINIFNSKITEMEDSIRNNDFSLVELTNVGNGPIREYSSLWDYGCHEVAVAYELNNWGDCHMIESVGKENRYYFKLKFKASLVNILIGSGFPERVNTKQVFNKTSMVTWVDKRQEPLLKNMLESFISNPRSNINESARISEILKEVERVTNEYKV